ncbi:hypothetical protein [Microbacterium aerolatum]|uniref:hypothetical protein n=1 Tax=Microbacterium aerolatum TaxID=153731 RepID=UPI00384B220C
MPYLLNPDAYVVRDPSTQRLRLEETARTEWMLAQDLGISRMQLRLLRWRGCAPNAIRFEGVIYYPFEDIAQWHRRFE